MSILLVYEFVRILLRADFDWHLSMLFLHIKKIHTLKKNKYDYFDSETIVVSYMAVQYYTISARIRKLNAI